MESTPLAPHAPVQLVLAGPRASRPARLASVVVEELAVRIISGALPDGSLLPTEPALCEAFGFSRTVIREALKLLQQRGLVRVEQGRGTTVQPRTAWNLLDPLVIRLALEHDHDMSLLDNLIAVRRVLEREMARSAAVRLTDDELAALARNIDEADAACYDYGRFRTLDQEFHAIVMQASGNEVGLTIVRTIHQHAGGMPPLSEPQPPSELARTAMEHRSIYGALAARDSAAAAERISAHIDFAWAGRKHARAPDEANP